MTELTGIHESKSFKDFCKRSFDLLIARNPVGATHIGISDYNHLWPDISKEGVLKDIEILNALQTKLKEFSSGPFDSKEEEEDFLLLEWSLDIALFEMEEMRFWTANPRISGLILSGTNSLLLKTHPSAEKRAKALIQRLKGIQRLIDDVKTRITEPVQLWINGEMRGCQALPSFFESIPEAFPSIIEEDKQILSEAVKTGLDSINQYQKWLQSIKGSPNLPTKKALYEKLVMKRRLGLSAYEIEDLGRYYLQFTEKILKDLVSKLPGDSISEVRDNIRKKHPESYEKALENYKQLAKKAKSFLIDNDILSMPPNENHEVVWTPPPMRHLMSQAGASPPGKFDDPQTGRFWLCPHDDPKMLEEHPNAWASIVMCHESYPGHNLHGICANTNPSPVRTRIFVHPSPNMGFMYPSQTAEVLEGWGLYCEEMMLNHGFEYDPANPNDLENLEKQFTLINALRWRAARIVIDVQLHTERLSYEEGVKFLQKATGFRETMCRAEVLMYSQSPGYFFSYLLGKHLLVNLKQELEIPEKEFHDGIVYSGTVPFWFLKERVFNS